jgi:hypothetical protein
MHHRCHNLLPRLAQICMYTSLVLAISPWALWKLFSSLPAGFNGFAGACSTGFACASMLLALDSIATPMAFMRKCVRRRSHHCKALALNTTRDTDTGFTRRYSWIEFMYPNGVFNERWRDVMCGLFAAPLP